MLSSWHNVVFILVGFIGIALLIIVHECGHFIMCKIFGVRTPSFSVGYGPRLITKKFGETEFSISAIPLGGYVEIAGSAEVGQGEQHEALARDEGSFAVRPFYQKFLIMFGGILFNIFFAYAIMMAVFFFGLPKTSFLYPLNATNTIAAVEPNSPASGAGLKVGDRIVSCNGTNLEANVCTFFEIIQAHAGKPLELRVEHDNVVREVSVIPTSMAAQGVNVGFLGVTFAMNATAGVPLWQSCMNGAHVATRYIVATAAMLKHIFVRRDVKALGGPVMIINIMSQNAAQGFKVFLILLAIISINLAVLNMIPLPVFDGGQILIYGIEAAVGRSLEDKARLVINLISWGLVMVLFVYLTFQDIWRIVTNIAQH